MKGSMRTEVQRRYQLFEAAVERRECPPSPPSALLEEGPPREEVQAVYSSLAALLSLADVTEACSHYLTDRVAKAYILHPELCTALLPLDPEKATMGSLTPAAPWTGKRQCLKALPGLMGIPTPSSWTNGKGKSRRKSRRSTLF